MRIAENFLQGIEYSVTNRSRLGNCDCFVKNHPDNAAELRKQAEATASENEAKSPEHLASLTLEATRQTLHELRVHQIQLEQQNEELRRTQAELDAARLRYFDLYDLAPVGYVAANEKGLILEANLTAASLLGMARGELVRQPISQFILKEDQDIYYLHCKQLFETGTGQACELQMVKKDGAIFWARMEATVARNTAETPVCHVVLSDITKRKQSEAALRQSEHQYHELFESSSDALFLIDCATGLVIEANSMALALYGYNRQEVLTKTSAEMSAEPDETNRRMHEAETKPGQFFFIPERFHRKKDGTVFPVELTARTLCREGKMILLVSCRDVTERKRAEVEREKLEAQNRQLQKSESLSRMAGAIAHHFNNQLQAAMLNLQLAKDDLPENTGAVKNVTEAMQSVRTAAEVSSLMLTYVGQSAATHEPLDLSEVCRRSMLLLRAVIPSSVILETDLRVPGPTISANANQIQQALTNLLTNALEAMSDSQGRIRVAVKTVSTAAIATANRFPSDWQPSGPAYACLDVADTGCGIAAGDIEKVFEPFFSKKFIGRGLGLPVVLGIVRAHQGAITVESKPGRGSVFRVFLPLTSEAIPQKPIQVAQGPRAAGVGAVLVVDDEPTLRKAVAFALKKSGFTVLMAADGVEAVEIFGQRREEISCVLCDLTMPRMSGWQTLAALRKLAPDIPVILSSGYSESQAMEGDHAERPQAFLSKPYEFKTLVETIVRIMKNPKTSS
jgi:two-component system, cell cycle sensor histidine kinase and response regulator CckA